MTILVENIPESILPIQINMSHEKKKRIQAAFSALEWNDLEDQDQFLAVYELLSQFREIKDL